MANMKLPGIVVQGVFDAEITPGTTMQATKAWFQDAAGQGPYTPMVPHEDDLDDLIIEREWFDKKFPQRVAALVRHHRKQHGKDPQRVFLPTKFVDWIFKRWGSQLVFDIQSEPMPALFERVTLEARPGKQDSDRIRLDTVLESSEVLTHCGYCGGELSLLVAERWTRVVCQHCGKMLWVEWDSATGALVIHPDKKDRP